MRQSGILRPLEAPNGALRVLNRWCWAPGGVGSYLHTELRQLPFTPRAPSTSDGSLWSAFDRLGLDDPDRHFRDAIALHPLDAIIDAVAIFAGKRDAGTLPDGADARYLLGIVHNLVHVHEADAITTALLDERLAARDRLLEPLRLRRQQIASERADTSEHLRVLVDEAMRAHRSAEHAFWIHTLADLIARHDKLRQRDLFRSAARRVHATFRAPRHERAAAERRLARRLWSLD